MKFTIGITCDNEAKKKINSINELKVKVNDYIEANHYGEDILEYFISLYIVNPPKGYEHLHKDFKPKYTKYKLLTNRFTGEKHEIINQFHYSIKIDGDAYTNFITATEEKSKNILAIEILNSLSNFDVLPKKVKDFNNEQFKVDMEQFLRKMFIS